MEILLLHFEKYNLQIKQVRSTVISVKNQYEEKWRCRAPNYRIKQEFVLLSHASTIERCDAPLVIIFLFILQRGRCDAP